MAEYKHILAATDLHNDCFPVVHKAAELAQLEGAKLSVVNVIPNVPYYMASGMVNDIEEELESESRERIELVKKIIATEAEYYIRHGSAKNEIVALAEEIGADLIVIGSHGRRGVQLLLGSTATGVLPRAKCDVLVVRAKHP